jgi:hypothetical protein
MRERRQARPDRPQSKNAEDAVLRSLADVAMMQAADFEDLRNLAFRGALDGPEVGRIGSVCSRTAEPVGQRNRLYAWGRARRASRAVHELEAGGFVRQLPEIHGAESHRKLGGR